MSVTIPAKSNYARTWRRFLALSSMALVVGATSFHAVAQETLTRVQSRRLLNCGVSDGRVGFSYQDAKQRWLGLDADFCRAVAAAVIGDPERAKFIPLFDRGRLSRRALQ
jgi:general L-amino acid transport system substrate-binding protein